MAEGHHGARRPRPVADVPRPALAGGDACAKAWLLALIAATPLEDVGTLPTTRLATEAPGLCAAVQLALGSDRELERLSPRGDRAPLAARAGRLAGAPDAAGVARAVGLLREALWDLLIEDLDRHDGQLVAAAAARLAHVCDVVVQAALTAVGPAPGELDGDRGRGVLTPVPGPQAGVGAVDDGPPRRGPVGVVGGRGGVSLGEEDLPGGGEEVGPESPGVAPSPGPVGEAGARRTGAGAEPWLDAVAARLERHAEDPEPFAVLVVEVDDAERLLAADADGEALRAITRAEAAVRRAARAADAVVREHPGRLWIVIPVAGAAEARALGERIAEAAANVVLRAAPLTVSIGFATCPQDSGDAASLVAHADEGVFAARAAGVRLA
jgi:GGDEF domain-containing protein